MTPPLSISTLSADFRKTVRKPAGLEELVVKPQAAPVQVKSASSTQTDEKTNMQTNSAPRLCRFERPTVYLRVAESNPSNAS